MTLGELANRAAIDPDDLVRVTYSQVWLERAKAAESHEAIAHFDGELRFWLALVSAKLADAAIEAGDVGMAKVLHEWARERRVPKDQQNRIINAALGL